MTDLRKGTIDAKSLSYTIYRLCLFVTARTTDSFAQQVTVTLIQLALIDLGRGRHSVSKVCSVLSERFHIDFEETELEDLAQDAAKLGLMQWQASDRTLSLPLVQWMKLEKQRRQGLESQERVLTRWRHQVQAQHPSCSEADLQHLEEDLKVFLARLAMMWSQEFLATVYPNRVEADGNLADAISNALDLLPEREGCLRDIRDNVISDFLLSSEGRT
jgi:hypothetical protein